MINKILFSLGPLFVFMGIVLASQSIGATDPDNVTLTVTQDFVNFIKIAAVVGSIFIAFLAFIGVAFFGFDVRKARNSIENAQKELKNSLEDVKNKYEEANDAQSKLINLQEKFDDLFLNAKGKIEDLGEQMNKKSIDAQNKICTMQSDFEKSVKCAENRIEEIGAKIEEIYDKAQETNSNYSNLSSIGLSKPVIVSNVIENSNFNWTTLNRIANKTGFSKDEILEIARNTPNIEIGIGRKTKDHIFRLKNGSDDSPIV